MYTQSYFSTFFSFLHKINKRILNNGVYIARSLVSNKTTGQLDKQRRGIKPIFFAYICYHGLFVIHLLARSSSEFEYFELSSSEVNFDFLYLLLIQFYHLSLNNPPHTTQKQTRHHSFMLASPVHAPVAK